MLLRIYAKCLLGQDELAKRRIAESLRDGGGEPDADHDQDDGEANAPD